MAMRELSLFTGGGGGVLATRHLLGWETIGYVEWDDYCQRLLAARINDGFLSRAPIYGDIDAFIGDGYAAAYSGMADVITAGFPCQPFSVAGKQLAADDSRNKWPATIECIRVVRPRYCLLENVPGLISNGYLATVLGDLAACGFDARWRVLSAAELGAPHKRDRLWIVAYTDSGIRRICRHERPQASDRTGASVPDANGDRCGEWTDEQKREPGSEGTADVGKDGENRTMAIEGVDPDADCQEWSADERKSNTGANRREHFGRLGADVPNAEEQPKRSRPCPEESERQRGRRSGNGCGTRLSTDSNEQHDNSRRHGPGHVGRERSAETDIRGSESSVSFTGGEGLEIGQGAKGQWPQSAIAGGSWWATEPNVGRVANGVASRVDRLKALGNGQVPAVAAAAWMLLIEEAYGNGPA